ncbi:MAG TPA: thioesterase family protein [Thermoleophilaceae bacterium]|nr:thioesterase family protein [Thermoleophilaceae bacterium]
MANAFFAPEGDLFAPSELTRGPWDPDAQHAGPPAALIGRAIERCGDPNGRQVGRVTFEILRPVPIEPLSVEARVVRPGRSVELIEAELSNGGEVLVRATAWRIRTQPVELDPPPPAEPPPPGPDGAAERDFFPTGMDVGYHTAMEYRFVEGAFLEAGPATVWMRMRHPLVDGEEATPLQRVLVAADSGNGVSAALDWRRFLFVNTDLSVHLHRLPATDWVCLDARTFPEEHGVGLADTTLYDEEGRIGRAAQTLLVRER